MDALRPCSLVVSLALGLAFVPVAAQAKPEDAETSRVALLPMQTEGDFRPAWNEKLTDDLSRGLVEGDLSVVGPSMVVELSGKSSCADAACYGQVASATEVRYLVVPKINVRSKNYEIRLQVIDGTSGETVASSSETCELCGIEEAGEMLSKQAVVLRQKIDALVFGPAVIDFVSEPSGALVEIDGKKVGTTPFEFELAPGEHAVVVHLEGYLPRERRVTAIKGVAETLSFTLQPTPVDAAPTEPGWKRVGRPVGWSMLAVGLASVTAGAVFLAIDERPYKSNCSGDDVDAAGNCRQRYNTVVHGATLTAIGGALAVGGLTLGILARKKKGQGDSRRASVGVGVGLDRILLRGRF